MRITGAHPITQKVRRDLSSRRFFEGLTTSLWGRRRNKPRNKESTMNSTLMAILPHLSRVARKLKDRQKTKVEAEQKPITLASIPYVQGITEGIRRVLAKLDIHTVMKPMKSKWSLMNKAKDGIAPQEVPGVVYAIGCQNLPESLHRGKRIEQRSSVSESTNATHGWATQNCPLWPNMYIRLATRFTGSRA